MSGSLAITSATTSISMSATLPATYTATDFASLTWIPITEVSNLGVFGGKTTVVKFTPVDTAVVVKRSGSVDYGTISMTLAKHTGADYTALQAAFNARSSVAFKITYPGSMGHDYFSGIVTSLQVNVGSADKILEQTIDIELDNSIIFSAT
jgi:hypothetical protein